MLHYIPVQWILHISLLFKSDNLSVVMNFTYSNFHFYLAVIHWFSIFELLNHDSNHVHKMSFFVMIPHIRFHY